MKNMSKKFFLASFASGLLFAAGLGISGMIHPDRVKAFLDVTGDWNPSLAFVMASAVGVYFLANEIFAKKMAKPIVGANWSHLPAIGFHLPLRSLFGNILFGVGWGLVGYCPAPGLMSLAGLHLESFVFVGSLFLGFITWEMILKKTKLFA